MIRYAIIILLTFYAITVRLSLSDALDTVREGHNVAVNAVSALEGTRDSLNECNGFVNTILEDRGFTVYE